MAALTSGDWTITLIEERKSHKHRIHRCSMALATVGTYPSGGVPIPTTASDYSLRRNLDYIRIYDDGSTQARICKYSASANTIRIYQQQGLSSGTTGDLIELATTASGSISGAQITLYVEAVGW